MSPRSVSVWQHIKLSDISLWTRARDSVVQDEDFFSSFAPAQPISLLTFLPMVGWLVGFLMSSSTTRLYHGRVLSVLLCVSLFIFPYRYLSLPLHISFLNLSSPISLSLTHPHTLSLPPPSLTCSRSPLKATTPPQQRNFIPAIQLSPLTPCHTSWNPALRVLCDIHNIQ